MVERKGMMAGENPILLGYVGGGDLSEGGLKAYQPAFSYEGEDYVASTDSWTVGDRRTYRRLGPAGREALSRIPQDGFVRLDDGDLVCVCSAGFFRACDCGQPELLDALWELSRWIQLPEGAYATILGYRGFIETSNMIYTSAVHALERLLHDDGDENRSKAEQVFKIVDDCCHRSPDDPYAPLLEQYVEKGVYLKETFRRDEYEYLREEARLLFEEIASGETFDLKVDQRIRWIKDRRISDGAAALEPRIRRRKFSRRPSDDVFRQILTTMDRSLAAKYESGFESTELYLYSLGHRKTDPDIRRERQEQGA